MPLPQQLLDAYHTSLGSDFNGLPKMPRALAETRVVELQAELASLSEEDADYANRSAILTSEIAETQETLDTQNYSESDEDIAYWETYRQGLRTFIQNS